jgi:hypothetical protein
MDTLYDYYLPILLPIIILLPVVVIMIIVKMIPVKPIIYQNATQEGGATFVLKGPSSSILKFDGNATLDWHPKYRGGVAFSAPQKIIVPAGQHKFTISGVQGAQIEMDQILEAGHIYKIEKKTLYTDPTFKDVTVG